jgi:hypothetical protein
MQQQPEADRVALHTYHDVHKTLPPGDCRMGPGDPDTTSRFGWAVYILPQIEQGSLYDALSPGNPDKPGDIMADPAKSKLFQTSIETLVCPSDTGDDLNEIRLLKANTSDPAFVVDRAASANYVGCHGTGPNGVLVSSMSNNPDSECICFRDVIDGLSSTFAVGERATEDVVGDGNAGGAALWSISGAGSAHLTTTPYPRRAYANHVIGQTTWDINTGGACDWHLYTNLAGIRLHKPTSGWG